MSFLGGAECSTGRNPLAQFTKHVSEDKSLQRDRPADGRAAPGMGGMRTMGGEIAGADKQVRFRFVSFVIFSKNINYWMETPTSMVRHANNDGLFR